jgi:MscS family membrane protein
MDTMWRNESRLQRNASCGRRLPRLWIAIVSIGLGVAIGAAAHAQATPQANEEAPPRDTPRAAMRGYLEACRAGDYDLAATYLDLHGLAPAARATRGPRLARQLKAVLDRTLWVDLDAMSDLPEGERDDGLPARRELVGTIDTSKGPVPVLLERVPATNGALLWKIAATTVAQIPALYQEVGYGALAEYLPAVFFQIQVLDLQLWQWVGLLLLLVAVAAGSWAATALIVRLARPVVRRSRTTGDDEILQLAAGPLCLLVAVALFSAGSHLLGLAIPVQNFLAAVQKAATIIAVTWLLVRLVGAVAQAVEGRLVARGQAVALSVVPLGRRSVQILIIGLAALAVLQNLGVNVTGLLAGLGIGGLAVALAAQKTVENLFGGITLIADQPVRVGDFCRFSGTLGTVEEVGLRSTRVRTLDRTLVTIPNAEFASMQLENFTKRDRIWFHTTIGVRYETTPDQLRYVLIELKKLLVSHPKVDPDPARPRFVGFGACSLDIEIFAYIRTNDYNEFLAIQEDLLLRIMDVVAAGGTGFAFPSQTIYAAKDTGMETEKRQAAESQVQQWRQRDRLGLPYIRAEQLTAWRGTLQYPPAGSAAGG